MRNAGKSYPQAFLVMWITNIINYFNLVETGNFLSNFGLCMYKKGVRFAKMWKNVDKNRLSTITFFKMWITFHERKKQRIKTRIFEDKTGKKELFLWITSPHSPNLDNFSTSIGCG